MLTPESSAVEVATGPAAGFGIGYTACRRARDAPDKGDGCRQVLVTLLELCCPDGYRAYVVILTLLRTVGSQPAIGTVGGHARINPRACDSDRRRQRDELRHADPAIAAQGSLPIIDGWTATRQLRSDPRTSQIPVIALTAHATGRRIQVRGTRRPRPARCAPQGVLGRVEHVEKATSTARRSSHCRHTNLVRSSCVACCNLNIPSGS